MEYFIVRSDEVVTPAFRDQLIKEGKAITAKELMLMNTSARLEYLKGNKMLNGKLIKATNDHVERELKAHMESDHVLG